MKSIFSLIIFIFFAPFCLNAETKLDSLLSILDIRITEKQKFINTKEELTLKFISEREKSNNPDRQIALNNSIFEECTYYKFEEALNALNYNQEIAKEQGDQELHINSEIDKMHLYVIYGLFREAENSGHLLERLPMTPRQKKYFLETKVRLYFYMRLNALSQFNKNQGSDLFRKSTKELKEEIPRLEDLSWDLQYIYLKEQKNIQEIEKLIEKAAEAAEFGKPLYSLVCFWKSELARQQSNLEEECYQLALGTLSDLEGGITISQVSYLLAYEIFKMGNIYRAQNYINCALKNSNISQSFIDRAKISQLVADINSCYVTEHRKYEQRLININRVICFLILILVITIGKMTKEKRRQKKIQAELEDNHAKQIVLNKKMNDLNKALSQANLIKEEYLGIFLGMRPYYIERMEDYRKQIIKFLKSGKITDLHDFCRRNKFEEEHELLYKEFDQMFLSIIPSFIDDFNKLLTEEARIYPKQGDMSIELRIFALIRLGVKDSGQIAKYLRYSANTIYNYRSRIKNSSLLPREEFETAVMKIGLMEKQEI